MSLVVYQRIFVRFLFLFHLCTECTSCMMCIMNNNNRPTASGAPNTVFTFN